MCQNDLLSYISAPVGSSLVWKQHSHKLHLSPSETLFILVLSCNFITSLSRRRKRDYDRTIWSKNLSFFFSIHICNHIMSVCWKVSIVTQFLIFPGTHLERPRTENNAPPGTSCTLAGSECFLSRRTCCDINPGDNMLIYSAAEEAKRGPAHTLQ